MDPERTSRAQGLDGVGPRLDAWRRILGRLNLYSAPLVPAPAVGAARTATRAFLRTSTTTATPISSASAVTVSTCPWPTERGVMAPMFANGTSFWGVQTGGRSSQNLYPHFMADVNGDGKADIVGFAQSGVYVSINTS